MPKLWTETIEAHHRAVTAATLDAAAGLVEKLGLSAVTMSQIADRTGIGRATLYKYFPNIEAVLVAWHERQVQIHLANLVKVRDQAVGPEKQLEAVLHAFALISHRRHDGEIASVLHRGSHVARAQRHLVTLFRDLIKKGVEAGHLRNDVSAEELASFCLHSLTAASSLPSRAAVRRLVTVTIAGLRS